MSLFFPENSPRWRTSRKRPGVVTTNIGGIPKLPVYTKPGIPDIPPKPDTGGFYPFQDYYGSLLTKLASMRDLALQGLRTDLEGRSKAIEGMVAASRGPLNQNYSTAIQEAAAVNDAVANRLSAQGTGGTEDLRSKLAALGQDPTAAVSDVSKYYSGLGGANYAKDAGDVQRLIGRQAEENTLLDKEPLLARQALESDYSKNAGDLISEYLNNAFDLSEKGAESRASYEKDKFGFLQDQAQIGRETAQKEEETYWDNYWKKQDYLFRKWQTNIASGDKAAALKTKEEIAAAQRKAQMDIANIRSRASTDKANAPKPFQSTSIKGHATTYDPNTGTYYYPGTKTPVPQSVLDNWAKTVTKPAAKKAPKDSWNTPGSAKNARVVTTVNKALYVGPGLRVLRSYATDDGIRGAVKRAVRSSGIDPNSPAGKKFVEQQLKSASGKTMANGNKYVYARPKAPIKRRGK